jgi:hypothetical protein
MTWGLRFRLRQHVKESLWVLPLVGGIIGGLLGAAGLLLDDAVELPGFWQYSPTTAGTVLSAIVASTAALTGFIVTVSVLVVQMATGTFSARYMRLWYRDRMLKALLAVTIGTLTFSFQLLRQIEADFVPNLGVTLAGTLMVLDLLLFLFFLDRFIHQLRPVAVAALVARRGPQCIRAGDARRRGARCPGAPRRAVRVGGAAHARRPRHAGRRDPGDRRSRSRAFCERARLPAGPPVRSRRLRT